MSPKVPAAYKQARLEEILTAAEDSFIEKGLHNTTMQDIYQRCELSPGAVYNYFPSKDEIVIAVVERFNEWSVAQMKNRLTQNADESLMDIIRWLIDLLKAPDRKQIVTMQLDFYSEATRNKKICEAMIASQDATHAIIIALIKHNQREGRFNPELDPESVARAIMSLTFGIAIHQTIEPDLDLDSYLAVYETFLRGVFIEPDKKERRK